MEDPIAASLQKALPSWSKFNLDSRRPNLDSCASAIKDQNKASQTSRKALAEATKHFKKSFKQAETALASNDDAEKKEEVAKQVMDNITKASKQIVKSYQEEIDQLTRRCKYSSNTFLDLYKSLYELPDPAPLLSSASEHLDANVRQIQHLLKGMEEIQNEMEERTRKYEDEIGDGKRELEGWKEKLNEEKSRCEELKREFEKERLEFREREERLLDEKGTGSQLSTEEREELIELRKDVAEYEVEFKDLKNQDITIKKLNTKIEDLIENQEHVLQKELKKAQEHLAETEGRRATEALEREATLERKLASIELELKAERAGREATQTHLLQADEGQNEREAAWEAQRQILVDDADRLRETLHVVRRERDDLSLRASAALSGNDENVVGGEGQGVDGLDKEKKGGSGALSMSQAEVALERKAYEAEVNELTVTVTAMREEIKVKEERTFELQRSMQATIESLENERTFLVNKVKTLEHEIADAPTREMVDKIRRELRILKKLEYNAIDGDGDADADKEDEPELTSSANGDEKDDDLESVLIGKLRKAETELVKERREKSDHLSECEELRKKLVEMEKAKTEADTLAIRLEADLEKAIGSSSDVIATRNNEESKRSDVSFSTAHDPSTLQRIIDPTAPVPAPTATEDLTSDKVDSATEKKNDDHSVATIVMAQRDRLRARCDALEAERDSFKRELQVQVSTAESLKVDNTKLYEKVRYLQNYNNKSAPSNTAGHRDLDLEALEQRYEQSVDPFRQFSRAEKQRKMKEMSPVERTVFVVAKTVLGSKEMRTALFFYVLGMHLLVFITTYHWSHGCGSSYPTADNHPDHLAHFHGGVPEDEKTV